jgi:hypothetical protein
MTPGLTPHYLSKYLVAISRVRVTHEWDCHQNFHFHSIFVGRRCCSGAVVSFGRRCGSTVHFWVDGAGPRCFWVHGAGPRCFGATVRVHGAFGATVRVHGEFTDCPGMVTSKQPHCDTTNHMSQHLKPFVHTVVYRSKTTNHGKVFSLEVPTRTRRCGSELTRSLCTGVLRHRITCVYYQPHTKTHRYGTTARIENVSAGHELLSRRLGMTKLFNLPA